MTILWSEGGASFEPYHLENAALDSFYEVARKARERLAEATASGSSDAGGELATLGHQLYRLLFQLDAPTPASQAVHAWWQGLVAKDAVTSLEMVSDRPGCVPWNVVYDQEPDAGAIQHFWGFRFALGVGRRVSPHRVFPYLVSPALLIALDPILESQLSTEERRQLDELAANSGGAVVRSFDTLTDRLRQQGPDVLVILSRVERGRILMGDDAGTLRDVRQALVEAEAGSPQPLVLLLGSGAADAVASWECFLGAATSELSSVVAAEVPGSAALNVRAALAWLTQFLSAQLDLGSALRHTRQLLGLAGLAYSGFCPPYVRVLLEGMEPDAGLPGPTLQDLPAQPYRGLAPFDREERALFLGREDDTVRFARLLDDAGTRGLLLHGGAGVGKASFLRAGVVPFLEDEALGYLAMRDRSDPSQTQSERDYPTLALRASGDLAGQLAAALTVFCAQPFTFGTPAGGSVTIDLPGILSNAERSTPVASTDAIQARAPAAAPGSTAISAGAVVAVESAAPSAANLNTEHLATTLANDSSALGRLLDEITRRLPCEPVIVIEQAEDLLAESTATAVRRRQAALAMLAELSWAPARCKFILSLRTEMVGRLVEGFASGKDRAAWRDFFLAPLSARALSETLLAPTATEPPVYAQAAPHQRYRLAFAPGVMDKIVADAEALAALQQVSAAAIAQAACAWLTSRARERAKPLIQLTDLTDLRSTKKGRLDLALDRCVEQQLDQLPMARPAQRSLRTLMGKLHKRDVDGVLTRPLLPVRELVQHWRGGETLENAVHAGAAPEAGLLEVQQLQVGAREGLFVGLAHDALAGWAARHADDNERKKFAKARVIDALFILVPLAVLAVAVTYYLMRGQVRDQAEKVEEFQQSIKKEIEPLLTDLMAESRAAPAPLYAGALAQADQALRAGNLLRARQHLLSQLPFANMEKHQQIDRRGFEWRYLWRLANPERQALSGHRGLVHAVAAAPDSSLLATAGADHTVRLWNLKRQGEVAAILTGHTGPVLAVAFAQDGKTLASAGADGVVRIWDVKIGEDEPLTIDQPRKLLARHTGPAQALAFGKDANTLVSGGVDKTVLLWDITAGEPKATLKDHAEEILAVAFAADGKAFAAAGKDGNVIVWDAAGAKKLASVKAAGPVSGLAFSPDSALLASASNETQAGAEVGVIRFWDVPPRSPPSQGGAEGVAAPPIFQGTGLFSVAFRPNSNIVVSAGKDHTVRAWDMKTGKEQLALRGHLGWVQAVAVTADGATVATSSYDNTVKLWDWTTPSDVLTHGDWVQALAISSDDDLLASGGRDGIVKVWRLATSELVGEFKAGAAPITGLAFVENAAPAKEGEKKAQKLVVGSASADGAGSVKTWEVAIAFRKLVVKEGPALQGHAKGVLCLAASKKQMLATGGADGVAILWDLATGQKKHTLAAEHPVLTVAFSPGGARLATGDQRGNVRLWDAANGQIEQRGPGKEVSAHAGGVNAFVFRGEDYEFLSAGADLSVKYWTWKANKSPQAGLVARGHSQSVSSLVMLGDTAFASGAWDGTVKLWDLRDGGAAEERFTMLGHTGPVRALTATSNRQVLASAGHDGTIRLWRASPK